jgi:hypothetical protein
MGVRTVVLTTFLGVLASHLAAEVEIRQSGDRVSLTAVSAPAAEILDRLARQTGMRIVYDAQPPRQLITTRLEQRTAAEAVLGIMEGLGLNYALVMDSAGTQVEQLLILGPAGVTPQGSGTQAAAAPPRRRTEPAELQVDEQDDGFSEEGDEEEDAAAVQAAPAADNPAAAAVPVAPPPDYPSSSFTPRLPPPPAPAPAAANPAAAGATPAPQPSPPPR